MRRVDSAAELRLAREAAIRLKRRLLAAFMLGAALSSAKSPAFAQNSPPDVYQLSRNLDDAEASFQYAKAAAAVGDLKGAVAALERVLQINPDLPNIKLELGLLYLRLGETDLARSYLEAAVNAPGAPAEARARARQALQTARGQLFRLSGLLFTGLQYQTNPNGSPDQVSVQPQVPGLPPVIIGGGQLDIPRGHGWSYSLTGNLEAAMRLGSGNSELVLDGLAVQNWFNKISELNETYLQGRFGPRFYVGHSISTAAIVRPHVLGTVLRLGGDTYYKSVGGGLDMLFRPSLGTSASIAARYERRDYENSTLRARASDETGDYWSGEMGGTWQARPRTRLAAGILGQLVSADVDYQSRHALGAQVGVNQALRLFGTSAAFANLIVVYRHTKYDEPDLLVDADTTRREDRFDLIGALSFPLTHLLSLEARVQQTWNRSNLPNYRFKNTLGSLGVALRF